MPSPAVANGATLRCARTRSYHRKRIRERRLAVKRGSVLLVLLVLLASGPIAIAGDTSSSQVSFGNMVAQKGLWQEARFRFERALSLDPENAAALNNLGVALEQMGEFDEARKCYEKALELKPNNIYIQQNFDLFREADDKRNRKRRRDKSSADGKDRFAEGTQQPAADTPANPPSPEPPSSEGTGRPAEDD
jgi:tetratricopeptide (TPR) repeat protein